MRQTAETIDKTGKPVVKLVRNEEVIFKHCTNVI